MTCSHRASGFTLLEVLISMLVLALGIMAVAGLQVTALKNLQSSGSYAIAALLANDMAERMRVNQAQVLANAYNHTAAANNPADCVADTCSTAQMADHDINEWQRQLQGYTTASATVVPAVLPFASGAIARLGSTSNFTISVRWDDDHSGSTGTTCPPASSADLDCYQLTLGF